MPQEKSEELNWAEKLEIIRWLMERHDRLRVALGNRARVVLAATAAILAACLYLVDKLWTDNTTLCSKKHFALAVTLLAIVTLIFVFFYTMNTLINVLKTGKRKLKNDGREDGVFFNAKDTIEKYSKKCPKFKKGFLSANKDQLIDYALNELWMAQRLYRFRYDSLRWAIRILLVTASLFVAALILAVG